MAKASIDAIDRDDLMDFQPTSTRWGSQSEP